MFEISKGRFVDPSRILGANIYNKDCGVDSTNGERKTEIRVALDIDTENKDKSSLFAGPFADEQKAIDFIKSIPLTKK